MLITVVYLYSDNNNIKTQTKCKLQFKIQKEQKKQ